VPPVDADAPAVAELVPLPDVPVLPVAWPIAANSSDSGSDWVVPLVDDVPCWNIDCQRADGLFELLTASDMKFSSDYAIHGGNAELACPFQCKTGA
jgi:hypothetical protein